jgi:predicted dehydrogenase
MKNVRRDFIKATGAGLTASLYTGRLRGANDRLAMGFIGVGSMGTADMGFAMDQPEVQVAAICDVYQPHLEIATAAAVKRGHQPRQVRDFREILADRSIDAVCIATPDHWHPYMTIEACKAGKDVYVEKPVSVALDEGLKMVEAARKYKRVVQAGTMQRSGAHFQQAVEIVRSGQLGKITFCRAWTYMNLPQEGIGNPPDGNPPPGLDWDMWLGPAPKRPFNRNRWGADRKIAPYSQFRYFWDYAGGMMSDWGVHLMDIIQMTCDEAMPKSVVSLGGKYWLTDNRETPDTQQSTFEYPGFIAVYETRFGNRQMMLGRDQGLFEYGILFHGSKATLYLDRSLYRIVPEKSSDVQPAEVLRSDSSNVKHWANFVKCVRTREKPASDIEICNRSSMSCHLANASLRSGVRIDWDSATNTARQKEAHRFLIRPERAPWKLAV